MQVHIEMRRFGAGKGTKRIAKDACEGGAIESLLFLTQRILAGKFLGLFVSSRIPRGNASASAMHQARCIRLGGPFYWHSYELYAIIHADAPRKDGR